MRSRLAAGLGAAGLAFALVALTAGVGGGSEREPAPPRAASVDDASGRAVFARMGCGSCHTLAAAGSHGQIGPNLDRRLPAHDRASVIAQIAAPPSPEGSEFSAMPRDFSSRMNAAELSALVDFLLGTREG